MNGDGHEFGGVQFFDANGVKILEPGRHDCRKKLEIVLQEGERLIGTTSFKRKDKSEPKQCHLRFVIGKLE